jgi:hypothetical protein
MPDIAQLLVERQAALKETEQQSRELAGLAP